MEVLYHMFGRILGVYPLKLRPETIGLTYGIGTSVLNRFLASMAIDLAGGFSSLQAWLHS